MNAEEFKKFIAGNKPAAEDPPKQAAGMHTQAKKAAENLLEDNKEEAAPQYSGKLTPDETQDGSKKFKLLPNSKKRAYARLSRAYLSRCRHTGDTKNPPAVPFVRPAWLPEIKPEDPPTEEELRRRAYRKNVVGEEDLRRQTPKIVRNNNPQGLRRYILYNEWLACKNGFLYYLIPLAVGVVFLIVNMLRHNFFINAAAAVCLLGIVLAAWRISKNITNLKTLLLNTLFIVLFIAALALAIRFIDGFRDGIYLPFSLKLLVIVFDVYYCGKFYAYFAIAYAGDCQLDFGNTVRINAGKPRSGKTSNAVHDGRILALKMWERLQYDFWDWHSREPEILARNDKDELLQYYEIKISYNFYVMRPCIPCLWSNIGIEDDRGYRCHKVTLAHLRGIERLPLYSVVVLDEIGAVLKAELSNDREGRPYDVSDMFRLGGHFLKWVVIACEQDFNNIYIDCRRVVGFNQLISGQEWVCRSGLLCGIYNFFKFIISDAMQKKQKRRPKLAHFMHGFERFVRSIGFRSYKLAYVSNTQTDAAISGASEDQKAMKIDGKARRIVPSSLAAKYDDRAYKQLYPSYFDKEIKGELHPALHIRGTDTKYGRQFVNTSKAIEEKRGAIDELVQGLNAAAGGCSFNGGGVERRRKNRGKKNMP